MPKRITRSTVVLVRNGQRIMPPIGKIFDYTDKELAQINKLNPDSVSKITDPIGEHIAPSADSKQSLTATDSGTAATDSDTKPAATTDSDTKPTGKGSKAQKADEDL